MTMSLGLLFARFAATGEFGYRFLVWNLFLAAIPFPLAVVAEQFVHTRHSLVAVPFLIGWLLFLPNAPYLVTDILHLRETNVPLWYDTLLYGSFAVTGMLLCIGSLALVHLAVQRRLGVVAGWVVAMFSLMLSGFGVYLGRVERWNSWNFWQTPRALARSVVAPLQNPLSNTRTIGFTAIYGSFLCVSYLAVAAIAMVMRELPTSVARDPEARLRSH